MKKQVLLRALILMSALLVLNGCKGSDTAKDAKSDDATTVLEVGAEPLEELRYKIARGTRMTSTLDFASARLAIRRGASGRGRAFRPGRCSRQRRHPVELTARLRARLRARPAEFGFGRTVGVCRRYG